MRPGFWRAGFAVSLALNVFFIALAGSVVWRLHHAGLNSVVRLVGRGLAPDDAAILRHDFLADRDNYLVAMRKVAAAHQAVDAVLRARPFDPAALQTALDNWRAAFNNFTATFEPPYIAAAARMSQAGRDHLADRGDAQSRRAPAMMAGN